MPTNEKPAITHPRGKFLSTGSQKEAQKLKITLNLFGIIKQTSFSGEVLLKVGENTSKIKDLEIHNSNSSNFIEFIPHIEIEYLFTESQTLIILLKEISSLIYTFECKLAFLLISPKNTALFDDINSGLILSVRYVPSESRDNYLNLMIDYGNLNTKGEIYFIITNKKLATIVYKSEEKQVNTYSSFDNIILSEDLLCDMNPDQEFELAFYNSTNNSILGNAITTLNNLRLQSWLMSLNSGLSTIKVIVQNLTQTYNVLNHFNHGLTINLGFAIDFTISNGHRYKSDSLHHLTSSDNPYEVALKSCFTLLGEYNFNKFYPMMGFGGIPKDSQEVNHCFELNGKEDPRLEGINSIISNYRNAVRNTTLCGPTYFQPLVEYIRANFIMNENQEYNIFIICTDSKINDMDETVNSLVAISNLPISIIILGIGDGIFDGMERFNEERLEDKNGNGALRSFVQFVPLRNKKGRLNESHAYQEAISKIPYQIDTHFRCNKKLDYF